MDKQCNQEYETLEQLLSDNSFLISEQGENCTVNKEDPVSPVEVLANNVRDKTERATQEIESYNSDVVEVQAKVSEAKAMLNNHKERFGKLHQAQNSLLADGSGVQKIKNIIRAILRQDKDGIDLSKVNEDSSPTDILKFIDAQVKLYSGYDENPENISKLVKRLKKMVRSHLLFISWFASPFYLTLILISSMYITSLHHSLRQSPVWNAPAALEPSQTKVKSIPFRHVCQSWEIRTYLNYMPWLLRRVLRFVTY